ncbi:hypothetical protein LTR94_035034, partial [Friedmanniomyces endolithicus]
LWHRPADRDADHHFAGADGNQQGHRRRAARVAGRRRRDAGPVRPTGRGYRLHPGGRSFHGHGPHRDQRAGQRHRHVGHHQMGRHAGGRGTDRRRASQGACPWRRPWPRGPGTGARH